MYPGINEDYINSGSNNKFEEFEVEEETGGDSLDYIEETEREVFIERAQCSVFELHRRYKRGDITLAPPYQRGSDVWTNPKKSKLIESVLRNIPIPSIYFAETKDGKWEVIDGQQRLNAFFDYLQNLYALSGLPVLRNLNNKRFLDIGSNQRKIEDYQLHIFIIKKESHPDIKFDIFERINEGATQLNAQEIRRAIYRGERVEFLQKLAKNTNFRKLTKGKIQSNRLKDEEAVLRFLAFYCIGYEEYAGNLNAFLNRLLDNFDEYIPEKNHIEKIFNETMDALYIVFGEEAFVKNGLQRRKMNMSLYDILTYSFAKNDREKIISHKKIIHQTLIRLINDEGFNTAITSNTLTMANVLNRFYLWQNEIDKILVCV